MSTARFTTLLRLETITFLRQPLTWMVFVALFVAMLVAAGNGVARVQAEQALFARLATEQGRAASFAKEAHTRYSQPSQVRVDYWRDPTSSFGYMNYFLAAYSAKPSTPLGVLAAGQSDLQPSRVRVNFSSVFPDEAQELASPRELQLGSFDLAFVLIHLLPLGLIALSATRMSSEQDSGVLLMIAAQPVSPRQVAGAKFCSVALVCSLLTLTSLAVALLATGAFGSLREWTGVSAVLVAALLAYVLFWIAASAAVATLRKGAVVSIALMVLIWTGVTTLLPAAAALTVDLAAPPPSRIHYIDVSRSAMDEYTKDPAHIAAEWLVARPELAAAGKDLASTTEIRRLARDEFYRQSLQPVRASFDTHQRTVLDLGDRLRWLSPAMNFDAALQAASGSDARRHASYIVDTDAYVQSLRAFFEPRVLRQVLEPKPVCEGCTAQLDFVDYDQVPQFAVSFDKARALSQAWSALLHIGLLTVLLGGLAMSRWREWRL